MLISLLFTPAIGAEPLIFDSLSPARTITENIEWLEDPNKNIEFEDILAGQYDKGFQRSEANTFVGENIESRYWFRFSVKPINEGAIKDGLVAHIPFSSLLMSYSQIWCMGA